MWVAMRSRNQRSWRSHRTAGKVQQCLLERTQRLDVKIIGGSSSSSTLRRSAALGEVHAVALAAGQLADQLLLLRALKLKRPT